MAALFRPSSATIKPSDFRYEIFSSMLFFFGYYSAPSSKFARILEFNERVCLRLFNYQKWKHFSQCNNRSDTCALPNKAFGMMFWSAFRVHFFSYRPSKKRLKKIKWFFFSIHDRDSRGNASLLVLCRKTNMHSSCAFSVKKTCRESDIDGAWKVFRDRVGRLFVSRGRFSRKVNPFRYTGSANSSIVKIAKAFASHRIMAAIHAARFSHVNFDIMLIAERLAFCFAFATRVNANNRLCLWSCHSSIYTGDRS
jgi:hypothetical protein